jgi:hypothetical protein
VAVTRGPSHRELSRFELRIRGAMTLRDAAAHDERLLSYPSRRHRLERLAEHIRR